MKAPILIIFILIISSSLANEIDDIIEPLGLEKNDLKNIWHAGRCDANWSITIDRKMIENKEMLAYKALASDFFQRTDTEENIQLQAGNKCEALNIYYFKHKSSTQIDEFIKRDIQFIQEYGYSVLDAIYIEHVQFYTWNAKVNKFHVMHTKELAKKGLFSRIEEQSSFNHKPSLSFSGKRTAAGNKFYTDVFDTKN